MQYFGLSGVLVEALNLEFCCGPLSKAVASFVKPKLISVLMVKGCSSSMGPPLRWSRLTSPLPRLVVHVKFQFACITTSKIGGQLLLAFTSSNVLRSNRYVFPFAAQVQIWLNSGLSLKLVFSDLLYYLSDTWPSLAT